MPTKGTLWKRRRCTRTDALLPSSVGVSPRVAERSCRKAARGDLDALVRLAGRDPTQEPSRYAGGAAIGPADATHESFSCRSAGRLAKVACRRRREPPAAFVVRRRMLRKRTVQTPARRASTSALMTVAQGTVTDHGGAAIGPADWATHESASYPDARRLDSVAGRRRPEPPAVFSVRHRMLRKRQVVAAARSSQGCPQSEHSCLAAKRDLYAWLGVTRHDQQIGSGPEGPTPQSPPVGGRYCPL